MQKNLNQFEKAARLVAGAFLLFLSFSVFVHPVARLLVILSGAWLILEGALGSCPLYHGLGVKKPGPMKAETAMMLMLAGAQAAIGYVWWHAGWIKLWAGDFVATLPGIISQCAAANHFFFMRNVLLNQGMRYHVLFGSLVEIFEYVIGLGLVVLAYVLVASKHAESRRAALYLSVVGFSFGAFMNMVFYFAVGPTDPWIASGNAVMFWIQLVFIYGFVNLLMSKENQ